MGRRIGIVVCNYNKEKYVVNCVHSIMKQTINDFDIYVVDNASTDGSVSALKETFGNRIVLLENKENTGGAGGFDTGLRVALQKDYEYLMLVDNDVVIDENAIEELYQYMGNHDDVGLCGALVFSMDHPEQIMAYGSNVDMERFEYRDCYRGQSAQKVPEVNECDYVPACTLMVRRSVVDLVGIMDERNFIYWDDIDWAKRIQNAGYKVCAIKKAKVYHKGGGKGASNTFPTYYYVRNNIKYFGSYISENQYDAYADRILTYLYRRVHGSFKKGRHTYIESIMKAYYDGIGCTYGKAGANRIYQIEDTENKAYKMIEQYDNVIFHVYNEMFDETQGTFERLLSPIEIKKRNGEWGRPRFYLKVEDNCDLEYVESVTQTYQIELWDANEEKDGLHLETCNDIREIGEYDENKLYIDSSYNAVFDRSDYLYFKSFEDGLSMFITCHKPFLIECLPKIKENTKQYWISQGIKE